MTQKNKLELNSDVSTKGLGALPASELFSPKAAREPRIEPVRTEFANGGLAMHYATHDFLYVPFNIPKPKYPMFYHPRQKRVSVPDHRMIVQRRLMHWEATRLTQKCLKSMRMPQGGYQYFISSEKETEENRGRITPSQFIKDIDKRVSMQSLDVLCRERSIPKVRLLNQLARAQIRRQAFQQKSLIKVGLVHIRRDQAIQKLILKQCIAKQRIISKFIREVQQTELRRAERMLKKEEQERRNKTRKLSHAVRRHSNAGLGKIPFTDWWNTLEKKNE